MADTVPQWTREYYRGALSVYSVLLGYTNVGFAYAAQGSEMPSFLFCLDDIFESFVRNSLRAGYRERKISVVDGNLTKNQRPLFRDNSVFEVEGAQQSEPAASAPMSVWDSLKSVASA